MTRELHTWWPAIGGRPKKQSPRGVAAIAARAASLSPTPTYSGHWPTEASTMTAEPSERRSESFQEMLQRLSNQAQEAERTAACGMRAELAHRCSDANERACPWRGAGNCPKVRARAQREQLADLRAAAVRRGIPERVLACTWDRPPAPTRSMGAVRSWLPSSSSILLLSGANGCGKTTAAGWAASPHLALGGDGRRTRYVTAAQATGPDHEALVRSVGQLNFLVLDDLGQAYFGASGFTLSRLEVLVDAVYQRMTRLVICTDIEMRRGADEWPFFDLVGKRIASRILQAGRWESNLGGAFGGD